MSTYPILVEKYRGEQATTIVCEDCGATEVLPPEDLLNEASYICPRDAYGKPTVCGGFAIHMYEEADRCPSCNTLGFYDEVLDYCCSRVCQLQAEYARSRSA